MSHYVGLLFSYGGIIMAEKKLVNKKINEVRADGILLSYTIEYIYSDGEVIKKEFKRSQEEINKDYKELKRKEKELKKIEKRIKAQRELENDEIFEDTLDVMEIMDD